MKATEVVRCRGHPLVRGGHPTTFEVTKEAHLTAAGDCIIGIAADKGAADLSPAFRAALARDDAIVRTRLSAGGVVIEIAGRGSSRMALDHPTDLVWRRSSFVCGRTVAILCDRVAASLPRPLIDALSSGEQLLVEISCVTPD
ncbi:MAG: DUF371 domain-containing protein [Methanobacteriota archaeon]|nr:MAG: DUF371 domain-containing protein [Euryarchaeota archaeon]